MTVQRPRLDAKSGHAQFINADGLSTTQTTEVEQIVLQEADKVRTEYQTDLAELPLPPQGSSYVFSFNGLTGDVEGVSSVDGATGSVVLVSFDGGSF